MFKRYFLFLITLTYFFTSAAADDDASRVIVERIDISGNKRTKDKIILRELTFAVCDTLPFSTAMQELKRSEQNVFNLNLFRDVKINIARWDEDRIYVTIDVAERWYYIPTPIFRLTDPNINVWIRDFNADFSRTIYGLFYSQANMTGNNDLLKVGFYLGFSQAFSVMYNFPNINKKQTVGLEAFFRFDRNRDFPVRDTANKAFFYEGEEFVRRSVHTGAVLRYRKEVYNTHYFGLFYRGTKLDDPIVQDSLNSFYFGNDKSYQNFFQLNYRYESDHRNIRAYPTRGYMLTVEVEKMGLGIFNDLNYFNLYGTYSHFFDLGNRLLASSLVRAKISAPGRQPYYNQRGLGYDQNFVRGYETFLVAGQEYVMFRNNLKYNFWNFALKNPLVKGDNFNAIPFQLYLKTYIDLGYTRDRYPGDDGYTYSTEEIEESRFLRNNDLNNSFLIGGGVGLDIVTLYNNVFRIEYSINRVGQLENKKIENGLYLHFVMDIDDSMRILKRARNFDPKN